MPHLTEGGKKLTPKLSQSGDIADIDISAFGTTACGKPGIETDMTMAERHSQLDEAKLAPGAQKRKGSG